MAEGFVRIINVFMNRCTSFLVWNRYIMGEKSAGESGEVPGMPLRAVDVGSEG